MEATIIDDLRAQFNAARCAVRVITFLSPTCNPCRYGQGVVRALFEEVPRETLAGFIVWVPMLPGDDRDSAMREQEAISDPRLRCWFDEDRAAANTWSSYIGLTTTTWDVYAAYNERANWDNGASPPTPDIWMHQLNTTAATKLADRLDPDRLARQWLRLLGEDEGRHLALAAKLHANGERISAGTGC